MGRLEEPGLGLKIGSLFSGIGGLELGLEWSGLGETIWQAETEPFPSEILAMHWKGVPNYGDVRGINAFTPKVDVLCGGFPCQPVSLAGRGLAQDDPRWLWPEFERIIALQEPSWVIAENVPGLRKRGLGLVLNGLANLGYDAEWVRLSAAAVGAPHLRERLFIVGYKRALADSSGAGRRQDSSGALTDESEHARRAAEEDHVSDSHAQSHSGGVGRSTGVAPNPDADSQGRSAVGESPGQSVGGSSASQHRDDSDGLRQDLADSTGPGLEGRVFTEAARSALPVAPQDTWWSAEPDVGRVAHGIPRRVDRLKALGNAVVPECGYFVGHCIRTAIEGGMR